MNNNNLQNEDRLAFAEAYRVYEILEGPDKEKIPQDFVATMLDCADLNLVKPLDPTKSIEEQGLSKKGLYLVMYMCTFE